MRRISQSEGQDLVVERTVGIDVADPATSERNTDNVGVALRS